jgi:exonuclease VII small subunit
MERVYKYTSTGEHVMGKTDTNVKDSLDHVRAATQELHGAISDAVAKRGGATKADLEAFAQKAKAVTESAKRSISTQPDAAKKHLAEAVTHLDGMQKHVAESLKSSAQAISTQHEAAKKHVAEAVTHLEATQKHIDESLKSSAQALQTSVQKILADARASAQKVSEAVAAKRSAASTKNPK